MKYICSKCAYEAFTPSKEFDIYPGLTLEEVLEGEKLKQKDLAERIGYSKKHINKVVKGTVKITTKFAFALELEFGISAEFWINLQTSYDLNKLRNNNENK